MFGLLKRLKENKFQNHEQIALTFYALDRTLKTVLLEVVEQKKDILYLGSSNPSLDIKALKEGYKANGKLVRGNRRGNFETQVLAIDSDAGLYMVAVTMPRKIYWEEALITKESGIEMRRTKRLDVALPLELKIGNTTYNAVTKDISVGGLAFINPRPITPSTSLDVKLILPKTTLYLSATIVRCIKLDEDALGYKGNTKYEIGAQFRNIKANEEHHILSFIFERETELRARGLL